MHSSALLHAVVSMLPASGVSHGCPEEYNGDHGAVRLGCPRGEPGWFDKLTTSASTHILELRDFCLSCLHQACKSVWLPWRPKRRSNQQSRADGVHLNGSCCGGGTTGHSCPAGVWVHIPCRCTRSSQMPIQVSIPATGGMCLGRVQEEDKCAVQLLQNTFPAPSNLQLRDSLTRAAWLSHQWVCLP